ncbi:flagellin [Caulobacter sp. KR2-114]|uniref:flagellin n=1 Tax=Caulobacter sp. KR2-114 TaxID=3400912 RepID=UPI003C0912DF
MPTISTNIAANTALAYLNQNSAAESAALAKISSGSNLTSAANDAAGLAISTNMKSDLAVLQQAATNTTNGESVLNTADGALSNISDVLTRMKALAAQAQSGSSDASSLSDIQTEFSALATEISNIATQTTFNGQALLSTTNADGTTSAFTSTLGATFLTGTSSSDTISVKLSDLTSMITALKGLDVTTGTGATTAMSTLTTDIQSISTDRASVGAQLEQLQYTGDTISTSITNLQSASSAISDVDLSAEQTTYTNEQTLTSAAVSALTEANAMQGELLKVLQ